MENNKILATVAGKPITAEDVEDSIRMMGQRGESLRNPQGYAMVLDQLINQRLLIADATRNLFEREPMFKEMMARAKDELLVHYSVQKIMSGIHVTEADARKYFEDHQEDLKPKKHFNASHILVAEENKAKDILASIRSGEISFEDAARQYSTCPSSENGGNLGDFTSGQMVLEFENACNRLEPGSISEPVHTQFGWHIIQLNSRTEGTLPTFDEIKESLMEQLTNQKQQAAYQSKINQLKILFPVDKM